MAQNGDFPQRFSDRHITCVLASIPPESRSQGGAPSAFGYFSQRRKVTEKVLFSSFCRSKKNVKKSLLYFSQDKKLTYAPYPKKRLFGGGGGGAA